MIYLDNAATTFPKPEQVYKTMDNANRNYAFNSGRGSYKASKEVVEIYEKLKSNLRKFVNASFDTKVVLTASITHALNQVIQGIDLREGDNVYISPYEHNAVARTLNYVAKSKNLNVIQLPLTDTLKIDIEKTKLLFANQKPKLVICIHMSNVTGYILPVEKIFEEAKKYNAITVLDTAQSLGLVETNMKKQNIDILAFAGHKSLYGPFGIGGFILENNIELKPVFFGGTGSDSLNLEMPLNSEVGFEPSSHNVIAAAGLNEALKIISPKENFKKEKELTEYLVSKLEELDEVKLYTPKQDEDYIAVVSFNVEGYKASEIGYILDNDYDIAVRTGYHCAPYIHEYLKDAPYAGTVRVGLGQFNTKDDVDELIEALEDL